MAAAGAGVGGAWGPRGGPEGRRRGGGGAGEGGRGRARGPGPGLCVCPGGPPRLHPAPPSPGPHPPTPGPAVHGVYTVLYTPSLSSSSRARIPVLLAEGRGRARIPVPPGPQYTPQPVTPPLPPAPGPGSPSCWARSTAPLRHAPRPRHLTPPSVDAQAALFCTFRPARAIIAALASRRHCPGNRFPPGGGGGWVGATLQQFAWSEALQSFFLHLYGQYQHVPVGQYQGVTMYSIEGVTFVVRITKYLVLSNQGVTMCSVEGWQDKRETEKYCTYPARQG